MVDNYGEWECVARGNSHSEVWRARHIATGTPVAIKVIKVCALDGRMREVLEKECKHEVRMLQTLDHPNLIKYHESFYDEENKFHIVMELAPLGQMAQNISNLGKGAPRIEESVLWRWLYDIASALVYMHERRVLHRDVKPSNIFLSDHDQVKIGDFGISKTMTEKTQIARSHVGTPFYMSPEMIKGEGQTFASDIWSLGCVMYECAAGFHPFASGKIDLYSLGEAICTARYPALPDHWSKDFRSLVEWILTVSPADRPTAKDVLDVAARHIIPKMGDFEILGSIGRGRYSEVYRSVWKGKKDEEVEVALKRISFLDPHTQAYRECKAEVDLLKSCNHGTIIRYMDSFMDGTELVIVLELAPFGDLSALLRSLRQECRVLTEAEVWASFFQVSDALAFMHRMRTMHRDIKPANIFMCSGGKVKIGDLGLCRFFSPNTHSAHSSVGTPFYMSPEVIMCSKGYSFKSDVWSMGCVLYELTSGRCPFATDRASFYQLGKLIAAGDYVPLPQGTSPRIRKMCCDTIQVHAASRPSAHELVAACEENFDATMQEAMIEEERASEVARMQSLSKAQRSELQLEKAACVVKDLLESEASQRGLPAVRDKPPSREQQPEGALSARGVAGEYYSGLTHLGAVPTARAEGRLCSSQGRRGRAKATSQDRRLPSLLMPVSVKAPKGPHTGRPQRRVSKVGEERLPEVASARVVSEPPLSRLLPEVPLRVIEAQAAPFTKIEAPMSRPVGGRPRRRAFVGHSALCTRMAC
mmetsp:Transcript_69478/g.166536  ORF Transcript_69478/g.166536 Transcript_69478/m.166536 type:complete len:758 (-) Transcript_69478:110-2383(-)